MWILHWRNRNNTCKKRDEKKINVNFFFWFWILLNEKIVIYIHVIICIIVQKKINFIRENCFRFFRATRSNQRFWKFKFWFWLLRVLNRFDWRFIKWFFYNFDSRIFSDFFSSICWYNLFQFLIIIDWLIEIFFSNAQVNNVWFFLLRLWFFENFDLIASF